MHLVRCTLSDIVGCACSINSCLTSGVTQRKQHCLRVYRSRDKISIWIKNQGHQRSKYDTRVAPPFCWLLQITRVISDVRD